MSKISEFAERQNAFNDRLDAALAGLAADVADMKAIIETLQNSPGDLSPEDQASLDALESRTQTLTEKLEQLEKQHPPTPPAG